jgi:hypothetical protein
VWEVHSSGIYRFLQLEWGECKNVVMVVIIVVVKTLNHHQMIYFFVDIVIATSI